MNEKNINLNTFIIGFITGLVIAGILFGIIIGRSAGEIADLNRQRDQLVREYTDRQRLIESGITECLRIVETAGAIVERTGTNASAAISDLRTARAFIEEAITERENTQMELDRLRSSLHGLRSLVRLED